MHDNISVLGYLMQLLNISINNLSIYLNLERSTVSKWRSGTRKFLPTSSYFDWVIEYFVAENNKSGLNTLESLYKEMYPREDASDPKYLYLCTKKILSQNELPKLVNADKDKKDCMYNAEIAVYKGIEGRFLALNEVFCILKTKKTPCKVYIYENSNLLCFKSNGNYTRMYMDLLKSILDLEHKITIIHCVSRNVTSDFKEYEQLAFYPNCSKFFCFTQNETYNNSSYFIVKDTACLYGSGDFDHKNKLYSALYYDFHSLYHYEQKFNSLLSLARPMFENKTIYSQENFFNMVLQNEFLSEPICIYSHNLNILTMSKALLESIIESANLSTLQKNKIIEAKKTFDVFKMHKHNSITHIYTIENIENYILHESPLYYLGGSVSIPFPKQLRKKHLQNTIELLKKHSHFNISLVHKNVLKPNSNSISICKNNLWYYTFDYNLNKCKFNKDAQIANLVYSTLMSVNKNTPFEHMHKESVIKRLEEIALL